MLAYQGGDLIDYRDFYLFVKPLSLVDGYVSYREYLGASEPIYYLVNRLGGFLGLPHLLFSLILNLALIYSFLINLNGHSKYSLFLGLCVLLGFHFGMLYTELERLALGLTFIFLAQHRGEKFQFYFFNLLGILSHFSLAIVVFAKLLSDMLAISRGKPKINLTVTLPFICIFFLVIAFFREPIQSKIEFYTGQLSILAALEMLLVVLFFFLVSEKHKYKIMVLGSISLFLSPFLGGGRLFIIILPMLFIYCSDNRRILNQLASLPLLAYFLIRGFNFAYHTFSFGRGITL